MQSKLEKLKCDVKWSTREMIVCRQLEGGKDSVRSRVGEVRRVESREEFQPADCRVMRRDVLL